MLLKHWLVFTLGNVVTIYFNGKKGLGNFITIYSNWVSSLPFIPMEKGIGTHRFLSRKTFFQSLNGYRKTCSLTKNIDLVSFRVVMK